ncbi:MAG: hypothetical protein C0392_12370 [Syntrophus sp. (in: bacteria)]|nr:hypothetical protein [Syntrophus sp. (in: bacteria)]
MAELEFLADMNISPLSVEILRESGLRIVRITEGVDRKSKDAEILDYAREHTKVIITQDLDFSLLLALKGYQKPSLITLRLDNATPRFVAARVLDVVSAMAKELGEGVVMTMDETSARYRNLPVKA